MLTETHAHAHAAILTETRPHCHYRHFLLGDRSVRVRVRLGLPTYLLPYRDIRKDED